MKNWWRRRTLLKNNEVGELCEAAAKCYGRPNGMSIWDGFVVTVTDA